MKSRPRTYKTRRNAEKYADQLRDQYPQKIFSVIPDPRMGSFAWVVGVMIDNNRDDNVIKWALCS